MSPKSNEYKNPKKAWIKKDTYICPICGLKFRNKGSLKNHIKEHPNF